MACVREPGGLPNENDRGAPCLTNFFFFFNFIYFTSKYKRQEYKIITGENECGEETEKETLSLINIALYQNIKVYVTITGVEIANLVSVR